MVEVSKVIDVHDKMPTVSVDGHYEGPYNRHSKGYYTDGKIDRVSKIRIKPSKLDDACPHRSKILIPPDLIEVGKWPLRNTPHEADDLVI
jgi:hypothetical protein